MAEFATFKAPNGGHVFISKAAGLGLGYKLLEDIPALNPDGRPRYPVPPAQLQPARDSSPEDAKLAEDKPAANKTSRKG